MSLKCSLMERLCWVLLHLCVSRWMCAFVCVGLFSVSLYTYEIHIFLHLWAFFICIVGVKANLFTWERKLNIILLKILTSSQNAFLKHLESSRRCETKTQLGYMYRGVWFLVLILLKSLQLCTSCMCAAHGHACVCVSCAYDQSLATDMRHLCAPLSLQMPAGGTRLYCFFEMSAHSMCIWCLCVRYPESLESNLIIYWFIIIRRWTNFWDPIHQKPKLAIF